MSLRTALVVVLTLLLVVPSARAQDQSDLWHTFAQHLAPGSFVVVTLKNGKAVQGHLVQVTAEKMSVLPKTRLPVPARELAFVDVQSVDARKEGMSAGAKVLIGVGSAFGAIALIAAAAFAGTK